MAEYFVMTSSVVDQFFEQEKRLTYVSLTLTNPYSNPAHT